MALESELGTAESLSTSSRSIQKIEKISENGWHGEAERGDELWFRCSRATQHELRIDPKKSGKEGENEFLRIADDALTLLT